MSTRGVPARTATLALFAVLAFSVFGCAWAAKRHCQRIWVEPDDIRLCQDERVKTYNGWVNWFGDMGRGAVGK